MDLRICLSGPSGTGKTTLAKAIAKELDIEYIQGSGLKMIKASGKPYDKRLDGINSHRDFINESNRDPEFGVMMQGEILEARNEQVSSKTNFIIDRSPLDNYVYAMLQTGHNFTNPQAIKFLLKCLQAMRDNYSHLILIRFCEEQSRTVGVEDNGSRVASVAFQDMVDTLFKHYYDKVFAQPMAINEFSIPSIEINFWDFELRKETAFEFLKAGLI